MGAWEHQYAYVTKIKHAFSRTQYFRNKVQQRKSCMFKMFCGKKSEF